MSGLRLTTSMVERFTVGCRIDTEHQPIIARIAGKVQRVIKKTGNGTVQDYLEEETESSRNSISNIQ